MTGLDPITNTSYKSSESGLGKKINSYETFSYNFIVVPAVEKDGKYLIPKHVGEAGLKKSSGTVAEWLIIYDFRTGKTEKIQIGDSIKKSEKPGIALYNLIKEKYEKAIVITANKLEISKVESELEKIINETEAEGTDAYVAIGKRTGETSSEKEYKSKGEEKYKEEHSKEETEAKKEVRGKEEVIESEEDVEDVEGESPEGDSSE